MQRVFGPFILVTCVALVYAAMFPGVRGWMNAFLDARIVGYAVIGIVVFGFFIRLFTAMRLDEWTPRKMAAGAVLALMVALVRIAEAAARLNLRLAPIHERLIVRTRA